MMPDRSYCLLVPVAALLYMVSSVGLADEIGSVARAANIAGSAASATNFAGTIGATDIGANAAELGSAMAGLRVFATTVALTSTTDVVGTAAAANTVAESPTATEQSKGPDALPADLRPAAVIEPRNATVAPTASMPPANGAPPQALPGSSLNAGSAAPGEKAPKDLWERIRRGFRMPELSGPLVERTEKYYASKPDYVERMSERASRYLYHIVEEIERRNMPTEIALLPFIESAFNPQAMSSAKASGMWQFIPGTGKLYGLKQNMFQDDRRDVLESTRAALDYLNKLHDMFGDWHLALAAYNWGEGAVQRAIARNQRLGKPTTYEALKMPGETRLYVPKLQAVKNIIANPGQFNVSLPTVGNEEYFTTVTKDRDIDVDTAARFAGMSIEEFRALNPAFNKPVIVGATMPQFVLPKDKAEQFIANLDTAQGSLSSYTTYQVDSKDSLESIAAHFKTTPAHLRDINGVPAGARLRAGSALLVPKLPGMEGDIPADVAENGAVLYDPARKVKRVAIKVRKGETLAALAKRQHVSATQLAQWNGFNTSVRLQTGQTIFVERVVTGSSKHTSHASNRRGTRSKHTASRNGRVDVARR